MRRLYQRARNYLTRFPRETARERKLGKRLDKLTVSLGRLSKELQQLSNRLGKQNLSIGKLADNLDEMQKQRAEDRRWRVQIKGKLDALLRDRFLASAVAHRYPFALVAQRFNLVSQHEEDGMILALLATFGATNRTFIEIGSGTNGGNSGLLAEELGWRGLMVEKHPDRAAQCAARFGDPGRVTCICAKVTPETINVLLREHGFVGDIDVFSLDIDSFDYWLFEAMTACSPRILILEYNAHFGPELAVTIPLDVCLDGAPNGYHGASLTALNRVAERKGYGLLACDPTGTNAFFFRRELRPDLPPVKPALAYRPPRDRNDPFGITCRPLIDVIGVAKNSNLRLQYV